MSPLADRMRGLGTTLVLLPVWFYQICLRPILPAVCRFEPSCSEYFIGAVRLYGPARGVWKGLRRICRCHPWSPGGYDPP